MRQVQYCRCLFLQGFSLQALPPSNCTLSNPRVLNSQNPALKPINHPHQHHQPFPFLLPTTYHTTAIRNELGVLPCPLQPHFADCLRNNGVFRRVTEVKFCTNPSANTTENQPQCNSVHFLLLACLPPCVVVCCCKFSTNPSAATTLINPSATCAFSFLFIFVSVLVQVLNQTCTKLISAAQKSILV